MPLVLIVGYGMIADHAVTIRTRVAASAVRIEPGKPIILVFNAPKPHPRGAYNKTGKGIQGIVGRIGFPHPVADAVGFYTCGRGISSFHSPLEIRVRIRRFKICLYIVLYLFTTNTCYHPGSNGGFQLILETVGVDTYSFGQRLAVVFPIDECDNRITVIFPVIDG